MVTLKDVAKETGLTVSTVSRVLNNRGYISQETRQKVYAAMEKLNYQPNEVARSLSKQTTNTVGVIVPHISHPYFAELISHLESVAHESGYKILLFNSKEKHEKEEEYVQMCKSNRVAGVILCSGSVATRSFGGLNVPVISIERYLENGTAAVLCDNEQGGQLAAAHLYECGCRNVIHISGVTGTKMPADDRAKGFAEICEANGMSHREISTESVQYDHLEYHKFIENILKKDTGIDGIFASSDLIAAQVLQVCGTLGINVPDKVKLVGFDDSNIASLTTPAITTIHQPVKEMAQLAMSTLVEASEGKIVANKMVLPVSLVKRGTT